MNWLLAAGCVAATVLVYWGTKWLYGRTRMILFIPTMVGPPILIALLLWLHLPYDAYMTGGHWLAVLLGPATVAFAIPMHKHFDLLKRYALEIGLGVFSGSLLSLVTSVPVARWLHLTATTAYSLAPHSVTTPVAMEVAGLNGGAPPLAGAFVVLTGLSGLVIGQVVVQWLRIKSPVARGALFGMGAHALGTVRAFQEYGAAAGTVASLSMTVAAAITVAITPFVLPFL